MCNLQPHAKKHQIIDEKRRILSVTLGSGRFVTVTDYPDSIVTRLFLNLTIVDSRTKPETIRLSDHHNVKNAPF